MAGQIRVNLARVVRKRGFNVTKTGKRQEKINLSQFGRATGVSYPVLFDWLRQPEKVQYVSFRVLAEFCEALQCQPGDILEYVPTSDAQVYRNPSQVLMLEREDDQMPEDGAEGDPLEWLG